MKILNGASQSGQSWGTARMFMMVASMLILLLGGICSMLWLSRMP